MEKVTERFDALHIRDLFMADTLIVECEKRSDIIIILLGVGHFKVSEILRNKEIIVEEFFVVKNLPAIEYGDLCVRNTDAEMKTSELYKERCSDNYEFQGTVIDLYENPSLNPFDSVKNAIPSECSY